MSTEGRVQLERDRHVKYWKRCSQLLPEPYTSGEASRMSFGFFIVAALDLLGALETVTTPDERQSWIEWIYGCQVAHTGGFRGFTGTNLGGLRSPHNWHWDPANLPNTYFALATLVILGDDLARVKRRECMAWVGSLQRPNGSFGEMLGENNVVQGADDPRLCLCAVGTMKILQGDGGNGQDIKIDSFRLRRFIANCQSHEGGIGQAPLLEAHSGLNYCGIAALSFLGLLRSPPVPTQQVATQAGLDVAGCVRWMLDRQTTWIDDDDDDDEDDEDQHDEDEDSDDDDGSGAKGEKNQKDPDVEDKPQQQPLNLSSLRDGLTPQKLTAGFCGRCGKMADTCYAFWNVGALAILQQHHLVDIDALRRYLLQHVAHLIGGFGKAPGELPDILHSYLGLATLAIYNEPGLREFDPTFCFSKAAVDRIKNTSWRQN